MISHYLIFRRPWRHLYFIYATSVFYADDDIGEGEKEKAV